MPRIVLVVDDEAAWSRSMKIVLEREGFDVVCATRVDDAKQAVTDHSVDLTLVDGLYGAGADLIAWLKGQSLGGILVAHSLSNEHNQSMLRAGCNCVVSKELSIARRLEKIKQLFEIA